MNDIEKIVVSGRNFYLDNTKFFLITMVIWGHVLSNLCEGELCHGVDSFIYVFHMPLFIFISGYFTKVQDSKKFWKATGRLFETLIIFDVIHVIIRIAAGKIVVGEENFWTAFYSPQWSLWYLLSLISWRIMIYYVSKKIKITPPHFDNIIYRSWTSCGICACKQGTWFSKNILFSSFLYIRICM